MIEKFLNIIWFVLRPKYYFYFLSLIKRKFLIKHDTLENRKKAYNWAATNAVPYPEAISKLGIDGNISGLKKDIIMDAQYRSKKSLVKMGGAGHIHLLYDCVKLLKPKKIIETGVAYGWSSLAILAALKDIGFGKLISVDMPYPRKNNEKFVGIVVPKNLRDNWLILRKPDINGIKDALNLLGGQIDLCHYDSDKSWWGRHYAYPILWKSLKTGGLFISDDIQDNLYFSEFVKNKSFMFAVVEFKGKFVGLIRKL